MSKKVIRQIILDEPSSKDLFHGGGHERTAYSLSKAIVKFDKGDSAIGLDGSWGSGKSSVVEMAARKLAERNSSGKKAYHFFTFDIWKSQGSGFRRSFLEHFVTWAKYTFPKKRSELEDVERQIHGKTREIQTNNQPILDWYGIGVLVFLPFLPLYYFWAKKVFDDMSQSGNMMGFLCSAPFLILLIFMVGTLVLAFVKYRRGEGGGKNADFKAVISRLLLISSRQHQDHKVVQRVREVDPNDYEFHTTLREVLGIVQSDQDRVVVVLDNIDRLPKDEIKDYWALVRSIFSRTHGEKSSGKQRKHKEITAIVPFARKQIEAGVNESESNGDGFSTSHSLSSLASRELFSKTFDEVLVVAPPVLSNAREFFAAKLEEALPRQVSADVRFRTYRIFCELLNVEGGTTTPRQIVSFVNDLSGLYELHDGKFELPTVATFLAHQDLLSEKPSVLNSDKGLNEKIVELAGDEKLVQNLAAMVFNVEVELAFQILLDDEIAKAMIAEDASLLVNLSDAPGFDLRVDDVLQDNVEEWMSTGEFGKSVGNISTLLKTYSGDAKSHIVNSILEAFCHVETILITDDEHKPFLPIFEIADEQQISGVTTHFIDAVFAGIHQQKSHRYLDGQSLSSVLRQLNEALSPLAAGRELQIALGRQSPPSTPEFMFGLSSEIKKAGFELSDFGSVRIVTPDDSDYFETEFTKYPALAIPALTQFEENGLLDDNQWLSIANSCLSSLQEDEVEPENVANLIEIVAMTWRKIDEDRRDEIELDDALTEGLFFHNLGEGETSSSKVAQANLLFLLQKKIGQEISIPTTFQEDGTHSTDTSDAFETFNATLKGEVEIGDGQSRRIADMAIASEQASLWINFGKKHREHRAVSQVVFQLFSGEGLPAIGLKSLLTNFAYLHELLAEAGMTDALRKFAAQLENENLEELTLQELPTGFLRATNAVGDGLWEDLHGHVDRLLKTIASDEWSEHIAKMDHNALILIEKLDSSGCELDGGKFRKPYVRVVKDLLAGRLTIRASTGSLDTLLSAIDERYHGDIWRTLREEVTHVTAESLEVGMESFPQLIANVAHRGDRIMKAEKDNVIRQLLIPALEGRNSAALQIFIGMGYAKLKDFQNAAETSTTKMLEGAWQSFSNAEEDRDLIRSVSEAIYGVRKTKSVFDPSFWFPTKK
ncbi:P-loop NTPase fold protein [Shimia sp. Alg240-R146]|uniref:P-loop NTPase fold protein n=1 Tax=Shimia sp. Alg240-R146 TaxID=2993449 RepID=UPI0022E4FF0F|nr:P-loop NTPase fold protein [Shimia sp. Alg240-R146]